MLDFERRADPLQIPTQAILRNREVTAATLSFAHSVDAR